MVLLCRDGNGSGGKERRRGRNPAVAWICEKFVVSVDVSLLFTVPHIVQLAAQGPLQDRSNLVQSSL